MVRLDDTHLRPFLDDGALEALRPRVADAHDAVLNKTGAGSDMLGWRDLLLDPDDALLEDIESTAARLRRDADVLLCLGIGGSYLGARAVIDALTPYGAARRPDADAAAEGMSAHPGQAPEIRFAGHHTSGAYLRQLLDDLDGQSVFVNVISKSGTTLETALAFRVVREWMQDQFEDANDRILITTDSDQGALNALHRAHGFYKKYVIPDDVGGRFSVLTPVGLLPIAAAGIDIQSLFYGAVSACEALTDADPDHDALRYAAVRALLLDSGYDIETLAVFEPKLKGIGQWWQQLFGESEGKEHTGLFPSVVQYSTDLHSLGQYMQDGQRTVIETFLMPEHASDGLRVPTTDDDVDGLNYVAGRSMDDVTSAAYNGTAQAHADGGVPNMTVWFDEIAPGPVGELLYFFEHAVAVSGYLLGVNPFDQPGVEAYKREMYERLGR
jgi:glucose-6-phosphate isomerase